MRQYKNHEDDNTQCPKHDIEARESLEVLCGSGRLRSWGLLRSRGLLRHRHLFRSRACGLL